MKKVSVVVLNYKSKEQTLKCIDSIINSNYETVDIIVVDNNSGDGLEEEITSIRRVTFIQTGDNLGYSGGNNVGIKKALENDADFVFVLNPDATLEKNAIKALLEVANKNERIGIVGPKILFNDKKTIWYAGGIFDQANILGKHKGVDEEDRGQYNAQEETDFVTGGAMFIKKEVFNKIGFFDEKYFLYYEDSDFCLRAKETGFNIVYVPDAVVYHENAKSTGLGSPLQDYFITRNRLLYASKFASVRTKFALFREAISNIFIPTRRLALLDFLTGNFGKGKYLK